MKFIVLGLGVALLLGMAGTVARAEGPAEKKAAPKDAPLELSAADDGKTATVAKGKDIIVRLAGNRTTGYGWTVGEISGEAVTAQGDPAYVPTPHPQGMVGTGGTFVFTLQAVKPGKSTVKLEYVRPWEKGKRARADFFGHDRRAGQVGPRGKG